MSWYLKLTWVWSFLPFLSFTTTPIDRYIMSIFIFSTKVLLLLSCPWTQGPSEVLILCSMCLSRHLLPLTWIPYVLWHDLSGSMSTYQNKTTWKLSQDFFDYFLLLNLWTTCMNSDLVSPYSPCSWMWNGTWNSQSTLLLVFGINNLKLDTHSDSEHSWNSVALYFKCSQYFSTYWCLKS